MKDRILHIIVLFVMPLWVASCTSTLDNEPNTPNRDNYIKLNFQTPGVMTRAEVEDNECESFMGHLDVVIYKFNSSNSSYTPFHYERINVSSTPTGTATISKTKADFAEGVGYRFFVIANSTLESLAYKDNSGNILAYDAFLDLDQTDEMIHLTGVDFEINNPHYPQMFLMDGVAYMEESEPATPGNIVINDPNNEDDDITLKVTLRRAAAKVQITIKPGGNVTFTKELMALSHGYMVRNMPVRTTLSAEGGYPQNNAGANPYWKSTTISQSPYFEMIPIDANGNVIENTEEPVNYQMKVTLYCYSHTWKSAEAFEKGTSVVLMLPLLYKVNPTDPNEKPVKYENNYYQLSFSKKEADGSHLIKRNTYYDLRLTLNAPGAEDFNEPTTIEDIKYFTAPWEKKDLEVSGESEVQYLKVNKKKIYMYNVADDNTSLYFSSSSPVTVSLVPNSAYYYNKYNQKILLNNNEVKNIKATVDPESVSGNISVYSEIPNNNTIRYFKLEVINLEGLIEIVDVEQYPLVYITNGLPWYSYRDDYYYRTTGEHSWSGDITRNLASGDRPTTYQYNGDHVVSIEKINNVDVNNRTVTYTYTYKTPHHPGRNETLNEATGWTASKVRGNQSGQNYDINYYYFTYNWWSGWSRKEDVKSETHNVRNYHVRVMASSNEYTIGRPALDEYGHTARDEENSKLVSPSFEIASRLGAVLSTYSGLSTMSNDKKLIVFADHCKNYVEVDDVNDNKQDPVEVHDNWRLPTKAELEIITKIQATSLQDNAASIDYLLNGAYYMSASGPVYNSKNQDKTEPLPDPWDATDVAIRCVRDVF